MGAYLQCGRKSLPSYIIVEMVFFFVHTLLKMACYINTKDGYIWYRATKIYRN